tara:strand:- start:1822 stop:2109 length:288 start_codon:yes stop_codon:yes gene_type:complete
MDHEAIRKAYPTVITIDDDSNEILDVNGNQVTVEQSKIDEARVALNAEYEKIKYKEQRLFEYPSWADQLDYIYHNGIDKWKTDIVDPVKKKYPKP